MSRCRRGADVQRIKVGADVQGSAEAQRCRVVQQRCRNKRYSGAEAEVMRCRGAEVQRCKCRCMCRCRKRFCRASAAGGAEVFSRGDKEVQGF